jgi:hypothetical protein
MQGSTAARFFHKQQERLQSLLLDIQVAERVISLNEAALLAESHAMLQLKVQAISKE